MALSDTEGLDRYRKGGFWRIDDRSGARVRASDTKMEWNGAIVDKNDWEARQPQDFVRGKPDRQTVPHPRPVESVDQALFTGPLTTTIAAAAVAGATTVTVASSVGFHLGARVAIMLDNLDRFLGTITSLPDPVTIAFTPALPNSASVGEFVVDYTPPAPPAL